MLSVIFTSTLDILFTLISYWEQAISMNLPLEFIKVQHILEKQYILENSTFCRFTVGANL